MEHEAHDFVLHRANLTQQTTHKHMTGHTGNLIDYKTNIIFTRIVLFTIGGMIFGLCGTVSNIINIVVYSKIGILSSGSSNLNLFALSLADLGVSFWTLATGVGYSVWVADPPGLTWDPPAILYLITAWMVMIFTVLSRLLTAYVSLERCLCVVLPFHVKSLFTIRNTLICIIIIYAYNFISHAPVYMVHRLVFHKQAVTNISKLVIIFTPQRELVLSIIFYANYLVVSFGAVVIVFVCTIVTSTQIKTSRNWRKGVNVPSTDLSNISSTKKPNNNQDSSKDKKKNDEAIDKEMRLVKMITTISIVFLICFIPDLVIVTVESIDKRVTLHGQYSRLANLFYGVSFVIIGLNSSVNILIYYRMSTRYRTEFCKLFGISNESTDK